MAKREKTCAQLEQEIRKLVEQQKALRAKKQQLFMRVFLKAAGPDVFDALTDKSIRQLAALIGSNLDNIVEGKPLKPAEAAPAVNNPGPQADAPDGVQGDGSAETYSL